MTKFELKKLLKEHINKKSVFSVRYNEQNYTIIVSKEFPSSATIFVEKLNLSLGNKNYNIKKLIESRMTIYKKWIKEFKKEIKNGQI